MIQSQFNINLKESTEDKLKSIVHDIVEHCYNSADISHVVYENKNYFNCTNKWYQRPKGVADSHDLNKKCNGYDSDECEFKLGKKTPTNPDEVKYILKTQHNLDPECENKELMEKIVKYEFDDTILEGYEYIILRNDRGINHDHRGSDHCWIDLDFYERYEMKGPITLLDFAKGLYRIKSHKFDNWYEMFCGIETHAYKSGKFLEITVDFDHGS